MILYPTASEDWLGLTAYLVVFIMVERLDIEGSLRRINHKYIEGLNEDERERAVQSFKRVYAEEMGKASGEISRRRKVKENLSELQRHKEEELQAIEDQISQRMANFERNRSKQLETKLKEHKALEDNWRKRWETMIKKRRSSELQNLERSRKARQETEEFFNKKREFVRTTKSKAGNHEEEDYYFKSSTHKAPFGKGRSASIQHYTIAKSRLEGLPTLQRNAQGKTHNEFMTTSQASSQASISNKPNEIKYNRERFEVVRKEQEEESLQKMVNKLARIERNRMTVLERKEKMVMEARKMRQQRENPDKIAKNRQRSLDALNLRRRAREQKSRSIDKTSKASLNESITLHLQAKKQLQQCQFLKRQRNYSVKFQKLKQTKIDKLIKQAIVSLKHETLNSAKA